VNDAKSPANPMFYKWAAAPTIGDIVNYRPDPDKTNPVTGERGTDFPPWARTIVQSYHLGVPTNPDKLNGPGLIVMGRSNAPPEDLRKNLEAIQADELAGLL